MVKTYSLSYHFLPFHPAVLVPSLHLQLSESQRLGQVQPTRHERQRKDEEGGKGSKGGVLLATSGHCCQRVDLPMKPTPPQRALLSFQESYGGNSAKLRNRCPSPRTVYIGIEKNV